MRLTNKIILSGILGATLNGGIGLDPVGLPFGTNAMAQSVTQKWKRIDADNGAAIAIDLNSISRPHYTGGAADAIVCIIEENACTLLNQRRWRFDCRGRFMDIDRPSPMTFAPSQSVAGKLSEIACAGKKGD